MSEYFYYILSAYLLWFIIMASLGITAWKELENKEKEFNKVILLKKAGSKNRQ